MIATYNSKYKIVKLLLELGADVNVQDKVMKFLRKLFNI